MKTNDAAIGMRLAQEGRHAEALAYLQRAHSLAPTDTGLLHTTASILQINGHRHDAVRLYEKASARLPGDSGVLVGWARALMMIDDYTSPIPLLDRALTLDPRIASREGSLRLLWKAEEMDAAVRILRSLVASHPENVDLLCQHAQILRVAEYLDEAGHAWRRYMQLRPDDPIGPLEMGRLAVSRGDRDAARDAFHRALQLAPTDPRALAEAAHFERGPIDGTSLKRLTESLARETDPENLALLHDALARHHERGGEYAQAAAHVAHMNAAKESGLPPTRRYDASQHAEEVGFAIRTYTPSLFDRLRGAGNDERRPVFVVGLPRSGTTLLERMLASHPDVVGVGEQSFARQGLLRALAVCDGLPDRLTPAAVASSASWHLAQLEERLQRQQVSRHGQRVVDKLPDNYLLAGWIRIVFPNAILVHTLRDPRDVAWSCWSTHFAKIDWSLRLDSIAHRIQQHRRLMAHWRTAIPDRLVELRYERLVADPETELRRLLAAIGVAWHPQVMDFAQRKGFVASASRHQVREGIHARSIGRWKHYTDALQPILPQLEAIVAQDAHEATADLKL